MMTTTFCTRMGNVRALTFRIRLRGNPHVFYQYNITKDITIIVIYYFWKIHFTYSNKRTFSVSS